MIMSVVISAMLGSANGVLGLALSCRRAPDWAVITALKSANAAMTLFKFLASLVVPGVSTAREVATIAEKKLIMMPKSVLV